MGSVAASVNRPERRTRTGRKSADGQGTIDQVQKAGWVTRADGKRVWRGDKWRGRVMIDGTLHVVYGTKEEEAVEKLAVRRQQVREGTLGDVAAQKESLAAYLEQWLATKDGSVRARTHTRYGQLMRKHVVPTLGKSKLGALRPDQLQRLYQSKLAAGLSPRGVHHIHTVLHTALEQAVRWGLVARNIAAVVAPPSVPQKDVRWPSSDEVSRLLAAAEAKRDRLTALWTMASHTGMRQGELLGLAWDAIDLDKGTAHVRRILVNVKDQAPILGEPKTKRSRRVVPLTADAVAALRTHKIRQTEERLALDKDYGAYGLVFATHTGTPLAGRVVQMAFKRALRRAELPSSVRFHDLRHAAATMMLANGVDVPTVAAILGHSRNSTTLDVYAHAVPTRLASGVDAIQRALRGA